ncbi:hypothetical protein GTA51_16535 [Desulfovibrio aerotolerans]|uniref:Uncharacterized protein n=1 Tax=Solidesulfovibrio aerotolerans TaxID=295255 RepID=A0A7C9IY54_9BACT|nr:hypothetical protein [Solidesulfovibrio aerotolerans]MYL84722.1 hypothetical protein [Solidesulfovibrio aerotolerans]
MTKSKVPAAAWEVVRDGAGRIRELEAAASRVLHENGDAPGHRKLMTEKCLVLEALPEAVEEALAGDESAGAAALLAGLEDFARRAGMALQLESIFFMGALLYPDDYEAGDPNDLERFLERFAAA